LTAVARTKKLGSPAFERAQEKLGMGRRARIWIGLLPLLHLAACAIIAAGQLVSGVHYLIYVDFPFSLLLVMLGWRNDNFLLWFASLGTLWWFVLSWAAYSMFRAGRKSDRLR